MEDEVLGFLGQSNISTKNLRRLEKIEAETTGDVAALTALVREVAQVHPRKRRRWKFLKQQRTDLYQRAMKAGLLYRLEPEQFGAFSMDVWDQEAELDGWLEPWPWELEPTAEEIRGAHSGRQYAEGFGQFADPADSDPDDFHWEFY